MTLCAHTRPTARARGSRRARDSTRRNARADARRPRVSAPTRVAVPNARLDVRARGAATRRRRARRRERCARGRARDVTRCDRANGAAKRDAPDARCARRWTTRTGRARARTRTCGRTRISRRARGRREDVGRGRERERDVQDVAHGRSGVRDGAARGRKTSAWRWCRWRARRRRRR